MSGLRKFLVFILTPILFAALIGLAASTSGNINLRNPSKIESWLEQSNIYDHFVKNATTQAEKNGNDSPGTVDLTEQAVQNAAQEAFTDSDIKNNVNTFIEANYAWLEGKTDKPKFEIDLTQGKMTFADKVAEYAVKYTAGLPVCSNEQQTAAALAASPLAATCRPANVTPEQVGQTVHQQLMSGDFLSNGVITADNINPDNNPQAQPYYKKLTRLPQIYQISVYAPIAFAGISLISILGIIFLASKKRGGLKIVAWTSLIAGVLLVLNKYVLQWSYDQVEPRIFNNSSIGEVQKSLATFFNLVESALAKTELYFGLAYISLAILIFIGLLATRRKKSPKSSKQSKNISSDSAQATQSQPTQGSAATRISPRTTDVPNSGSQAAGTPALPNTRPASTPKKPKKPRLIQ